MYNIHALSLSAHYFGIEDPYEGLDGVLEVLLYILHALDVLYLYGDQPGKALATFFDRTFQALGSATALMASSIPFHLVVS
jgi:hypothetical protein